MVPLINHFLTALLVVLPAGSLVAWVYVLARKVRGHSFLSFESRRTVPWGVIHPLLVFLLVVFLSSVAVSIVCLAYGIPSFTRLDQLSPEQKAAVLGTTALASLAALVLSIITLARTLGANRDDFGVDPGRWMRDVQIGTVAFAMVVVPVFATQYVLTQWQETKHPIVELLRSQPDPLFFVVSGFAAVIVAPIAEEYFFRVFLQGALENIACARHRSPNPEDGRRKTIRWLLGRRRGDADSSDEPVTSTDVRGASGSNIASAVSVDEAQGVRPSIDATIDGDNPYRTPVAGEDRPIDSSGADPRITSTQLTRPSAWPILVSSALFAMAHFGHGPDPIPLFFLALGLGYVYQRTHRVLPCIVIHFLVNGISMLQLYLLVYENAGT